MSIRRLAKIKDPYAATKIADKHPVRSAIKPNAFSRQGSFASFKNGFKQQYESGLERACLEWLEINPCVLRYQTQPMRLEYRAKGRPRCATPDVRIDTAEGAVIIDVKPVGQLMKETVRSKLSEVRDVVNRLGYAYRVFSEVEIYAEPQRSTVVELTHWQWFALTSDTIEPFESLADNQPQFTLQQLIECYGSLEDNEAVSRAFMLMAQGYVYYDFGQPLSPSLLLTAMDRG